MIDLHSHFLPGIDDGAPDLNTSLDMARAAVASGVRVQACTPHILPGVYHNSGPQIRADVDALQTAIDEAGINLTLIAGADVHIVPDLVDGLKNGRLLSLNDSRYVLLELPHDIRPARLDDCFFNVMVAGYVPILTHPERLSWLREDSDYAAILRLSDSGVWMQITSASLTGRFGRRPRYWAERMLADGIVHILASDAHDTQRRPPDLDQGLRVAQKLLGDEEARHLVWTRPKGIVYNQSPGDLPNLPLGGRVASVGDGSNDSIEARHSRRSSKDHAAGDMRTDGQPQLGISGRLRRLFG